MPHVESSGDRSIDVLVVAYQSADTIATVVKDLSRRDEVAAVIVVDHGDDGSADLAEGVGAVVVHDPSNPGFGAGMNRAARLATADHLLLMNPDAELEDGALGRGIAELAGRPCVGAVQGLIRTPSTGALERAGGRELGALDLLGRATNARALLRFRPVSWLVARVPALSHQVVRGTSESRVVETLAGTAVLIRRDAFLSVDGFDERYFLYGEDLDLCRRLRADGWRLVYLPVPWANHENGSSSASWWRREVSWWEGTLSFAARWWGTGAFRVARVAGALMFLRLAVADPRRAATAFRSVVRRPGQVRRERQTTG